MQRIESLIKKLISKNFLYGSRNASDLILTLDNISKVSTSVQDLEKEGDEQLINLAKYILGYLEISDITLPENLTNMNSVYLGPNQIEACQVIAQVTGEWPLLDSGFRTPIYQTCLFSFSYLTGILFDADQKLFVQLPDASNHSLFDVAFDVSNSNAFYFSWLLARHQLEEKGLYLSRPYLTHGMIAFEPWHWEITKIDHKKYTESIHERINRGLITDLYLYYSNPGQFWAFDNYIFDANYEKDKKNCVGYNEGSFNETFQWLKKESEEHDWKSFYRTIVLGFTPMYDVEIQNEEIGICTFKIMSGDRSASITGSACVLDGLTSPGGIKSALIKKAGINPGENYTLFKSKTLDLIYCNGEVSTLAVAGFNWNFSGSDSMQDPHSMLRLFDKWIRDYHRENRQFYLKANVFATKEHGGFGFITRISLLWWTISSERYQTLFPDKTLQNTILQSKQYKEIYLDLLLKRKLPLEHHSFGPVVLLIGFLQNINLVNEANALYKLYSNEIKDYCLNGLSDKEPDWILIGYIAEIIPVIFNAIQKGIGLNLLTDQLQLNISVSINSAAVARILVNLYHQGLDIEDLLESYINGHFINFGNGNFIEYGCFENLPNVFSALAIEGLLLIYLSGCVKNSGDKEILLNRISEAFKYVNALQITNSNLHLDINLKDILNMYRFSHTDTLTRIDFNAHVAYTGLLLAST
jgi:hypothetical protein